MAQQHVKTRAGAKNTMLGRSLNTKSSCTHTVQTHTHTHSHKWSDSSHSECQLLSVISLVPQEMCEHTTAASHTHTHRLKLILLTMRADGKRQRRRESVKKKRKEEKAAALNQAVQNKHEALLLALFPVNPLPSHRRWLKVPEQQKGFIRVCWTLQFCSKSVCMCVCVCVQPVKGQETLTIPDMLRRKGFKTVTKVTGSLSHMLSSVHQKDSD